MLIGAHRRRSSAMASGCAALVVAVSTVALAAAALLAGTADASAASAYPPSPPCALSWQGGDLGSASGAATLLGSGLGARQSVRVVLHPAVLHEAPRRLGSFVTDTDGAFEARLDVPSGTADRAWLSATSPSASCTAPTPPGGGARATPATPASSSAGTSTASSAGSVTTTSTGSSAASSTGTSLGSITGTSTDPNGATASAPAPVRPSGTTPSPHLGQPSSAVRIGLPLSWIVAIAVLLVLAGGLAVLFLTRRAG